jgi:hypothetical protein
VVPLERPWKEHQLLYVFDFFNSLLNISKDFEVLSRFMQKKIQPPAYLNYGLHRIFFSYWLAHFYLMKKSAKVLLYFGLYCGMLKFFTLKPQSKEQLMSLPNFFGARFGEKDRGLSTCKPWSEQAGGFEAFLHEMAQNFEVVSNIQN